MSEVLLYDSHGTKKIGRAVINTFFKDLRRVAKAPTRAEEAQLMVKLFFSPKGLCDMWCGLAEIDEFALRKEANEILKGDKQNG